MESKTQKRLQFLDISRGIAIILMVCGHCDNFGIIESFASIFNMSVFIFISGYLFKNKNFKNFKDFLSFTFRKVKRIYWFYLKYELLFFLFKNFFFQIGFYSETISYGGKMIAPYSSFGEVINEIIHIVLGMGREPFCGAFWFFISLIFVIIGYSTIQFVSNYQKIIKPIILQKTLVLVSFFIGYLMQKYLNIPRIAPAMTLIIIFDMGNECYKHSGIQFNRFFLIPICFVALFVLKDFGSISINANYYSNPFYFLGCSIIGIYMMISLGKFLVSFPKINQMLEYIGQHTMIIMALHMLCFKLAMIIQFAFCGIDYQNLAYLKGYDNTNIWYILYIAVGVFMPLLIEKIEDCGKISLKKLCLLLKRESEKCI